MRPPRTWRNYVTRESHCQPRSMCWVAVLKVLEAFQPFFGSIMREGSVPAGLKQLIAHVVSRTAGCLYCQAHTGHFAHTLAGESYERVEAVWSFETSDLFSDAERAALRVARDSGGVPNRLPPTSSSTNCGNTGRTQKWSRSFA